MSESRARFRPRRHRDAGMTLPELLICITLMGLIVTVLASAITVTLRQQSSTEGRLNVARSEQSVGLWMPADLSSADSVDTNPSSTPCGATTCPGGIDLTAGSNVVMMSWAVDTDVDGNGFWTNVSYHFTPTEGSDTYELWRVECIRPYTRDAAGDPVLQGSWTCTQMVALRDLEGPPNDEFGEPVPFEPGVTSPTWVIRVSEPLAPDAIAGPDGEGQVADPSMWKDANRVIVTIDGGGSTAGAGGGRNQISITAGGTTRESIGATSMTGSPSFVAARSRCGGPITLVIDESGSIGNTNIVTVRNAVRQFINTVRGTPVQVQIVTFASFTRVLGSGSNWHKYYDMTDPVQVDELYNLANDIKINGPGGGQYTNWEDALFRVGYEPDGTITTQMPHTTVIFTDGVPTRDRSAKSGTRTANAADPVGWPVPGSPAYQRLDPNYWTKYSYSGNFHQASYNRAEWIAATLRGKTKMIAVGVGSFGANDTSPWRFDNGSSSTNQQHKKILADLITGGVIVKTGSGNVAPEAVLGSVGGQPGYVNPDTARLYIPDWSLLPVALRSVALGECAGTITFQTRLATPDADGKYPYVTDPFRYIADQATDSDGNPSPEVKKFAETNIANTARTFDLSIKSGGYVDVDFLPLDFSTLAEEKGYSTNRWECSVAGEPVTNLTLLPGGRPGWSGFRLRIPANGAASCTHYVNKS